MNQAVNTGAAAVSGAFASATATQLSLLTEYDFYVIVDGSASMGNTDMPGKRSRWDYAKEQLGAFGRDAGHIDSDGITVILFNQGKVLPAFENQDGDMVEKIFNDYHPNGDTPLGEALKTAVRMIAKSGKKAFVLVATDGEPSNPQEVIEVIKAKANSQQTDDQCTFCFIQIGHDAGATAYLKKLDDDLTSGPNPAKFDIVDTIPIEEAMTYPNFGTLVLKAIDD